jgi:hypothetical protein
MKNYPAWVPHPASIAVAVLAGAIFGLIESARDNGRRKRRQAEVWNKANLSDPMGSDDSGAKSSAEGNGSSPDSNVSVP